MNVFPTQYQDILKRIEDIDPLRYGKTRNYLDGAVTYLSPYISRGVISTKTIFTAVQEKGLAFTAMEKFIQELAWREYWQRVWRVHGSGINTDLKRTQQAVENYGVSENLVLGKTEIQAIDQGLQQLYETGYVHNHLRMYMASIACNIGKSHWKLPAQWMYYYLLDADWGSNALSWQWVAGSNSKKKYYANQENINHFCFTDQKDTFLDVPYDQFPLHDVPPVLFKTTIPTLKTHLPKVQPLHIDAGIPVLLYNFYNLDPLWKKDITANRVLLLEPSHFKEYPISERSLQFVLQLAKNISGIQTFVGDFEEFQIAYPTKELYYKEHPFNRHYKGIEEARDWMFPLQGDFPSFFNFWKKCKKIMIR
ncbi:FAD-binding domain-containing protein [Spongiimicrobium salis]|uniref:FAD-binding domain-containing protein n=1 Tax=Spongiimicrobium salis TaxID=1667022 RepID=UPI00374DBA66